MGLYDRDYTHDPQPGVQVRMPQSITMRLVLINVAVYLAQVLLDGPDAKITSALSLYSTWFYEPWNCYRLLTYGFLHSTASVWHIIGNLFVLWMFGRDVEYRYGRREYLWFYLSAIVISGLFWSISEYSAGGLANWCLGASGGISAVFVLFALTYPHRELRLLFFPFFPIPAWVMAAFFVAGDAWGAMQRSGNIAFTAHLAGAVFGLYYYKFNFSPGRWIADLFTGFSIRKGPKLRVHQPDEEESDDFEEVDEILRKISREGQESLTRKERRILERASREQQRRRRGE